jgi:hypothetical protein
MPYSDTKEVSQDKQIAVNRNAITALDTIAWTTSNYQPETINGLGIIRTLKNKSGGSIASGASVTAANLATYYVDNTGTLIEAGASLTGTWKNISGSNVGNGNGVEFVRIS